MHVNVVSALSSYGVWSETFIPVLEFFIGKGSGGVPESGCFLGRFRTFGGKVVIIH